MRKILGELPMGSQRWVVQRAEVSSGTIGLVISYSNEYNPVMYQIETTLAFDHWLDGIKDTLTRKRLGMRLRKVALGNLGDVKAVGEGVWEMREFFGPGWRMYYIQQADVLILMLGGGDKSSQSVDIAAAVQLARLFKE